MSWKLSPCRVALTVLEGAMQAAERRKYQVPKCYYVKMISPTTTNCSVCWYSTYTWIVQRLLHTWRLDQHILNKYTLATLPSGPSVHCVSSGLKLCLCPSPSKGVCSIAHIKYPIKISWVVFHEEHRSAKYFAREKIMRFKLLHSHHLPGLL